MTKSRALSAHWQEIIGRNIVLGITYFAVSYAGVLFKIPSNIAYILWPVAGIALGATLVYGANILPGIFLAAFFSGLCLLQHQDASSFGTNELLVSVCMAMGACLQAYLGRVLVKKYIGLNNPLYSVKNILFFTLLTGPISCLTNTLIGNTSLYFFHFIPPGFFFPHAVSWWVGDSLGVLIFTPLFLICFAEPRAAWSPRLRFVAIPLIGCFLATISVYFFTSVIDLRQIQRVFSQQMEVQVDIINNNLQSMSHAHRDAQSMSSVTATINTNTFFSSIRSMEASDLHSFIISSPTQRLYQFQAPQKTSATALSKIIFSTQRTMLSQTWTFYAEPTEHYLYKNSSPLVWFFLVGGLFFCSLANMILFILYGQKNIIQGEVYRRTQELAAEQAKNKLLLESAGEGIYQVDLLGKVVYINPAATKMLGYESHELLGKNIHSIVHYQYPDGSPYPLEGCSMDNALKMGTVHHIRNEMLWRKDGASLWVDYSSTPLVVDEKIIGSIILFGDISKQHYAELDLKHVAHFDVVTQLPNRLSFLEMLPKAMARAGQNQTLLAVCFLDLDNFKRINDAFGHTVGDMLLRRIPSILKPILRTTDFIARLGGDEFGLILEDIHAHSELGPILQRYVNAMRQLTKINNIEINTSASFGAAIYPDNGNSVDELIKNADIAMYYAKENGRNTYIVFNNDILRIAKRRDAIENALHYALERNEFSIAYQPLVNIQQKTIVGIEALLRWHSTELTETISPQEFIPLAEDNGMIYAIGAWVFEQACHDFKKISAALPERKLTLSINVSVKELELDNYASQLKKTLSKTHSDAYQICLELTESALMKHPEKVISVMKELKKVGFQFVLDDFGTGYSSMQHLKNLPLSALKIDKSFIRDIPHDEDAVAITAAIIQLTHALDMKVVAEGIENKAQLDFLCGQGCYEGQGFYLAKPMMLDQLIEQYAL